MRVTRSLLLLPLLLLAGCDQDHIEITVTPKADGSIHRQVRLWKTKAVQEGEEPEIVGPTEALLAAPKAVYEKPVDSADHAVVFRGDFAAVPADLAAESLANTGGHTVWRSRLGRAHYYRERFPGRQDIHRTFREVGEITGLAMELLATVLEEEFAGEKGLDRMLTAVRGPLKEDLQNIVTMLVAKSITDESLVPKGREPRNEWKAWTGLTTRVLMYAEERGYLRMETLPRQIGESVENPVLGRELMVAQIARLIGREPDDAIRGHLAALEDTDRIEARLAKAYEAHGIDKLSFKNRLDALPSGLIPIRLVPSTEIVLKLRTGVEPADTNGLWDAATGEVVFETALDAGHVLAPIAHAAWAVPDAQWQKKHLGSGAVAGHFLVGAVIWENSLTPERLAAWHGALEALDPERDLGEQIRAIRLPVAGEEGTEEMAEEDDEVEPGAKLMLEALGLAEDD